MDSINNSETFQANSYLKLEGKFNESLLEYKDFNNYETSNRKLIINKEIILWIHDEIVSQYCDLYNEKIIIKDNNSQNILNETNFDSVSNKKILELSIDLFDSSDLEVIVFDIFLWMYTKDLKKIKKYTMFSKHFLKIITLASHLKMNSVFYENLLSNIKFSWETNQEEIFKSIYWNRDKISFNSIEKIVRNMNSSKEVMIYAIVNWLKNGISNSEKENSNSEIYLSDSYKIKSLMKELDLTNNLSYNQLKSVYNIYKENSLDLSSLEITPILKDFLTNKYLFCIVCENEYKSYIDVIKDKNCKGKYFHPKFSKNNSNIHSLNNEKYECLHNNCNNKNRQDTFSCCHKIINPENNKKGCIQGFGKHQLIIKDKKS